MASKFRVVLLRNNKYLSTLHRCKTRDTAFINFHKLKKNNDVLFPRKFINTKSIKIVQYKICVTKITEEGDIFRTLVDDYGRQYQEKPLGDWTILHSDTYEIEETFWIYGMDSKANRPTIKAIIPKLVNGAWSKNLVKQAIVVHNKLIIYNEDQFDMVICKCIEDAQRLHHTLSDVIRKQKIKSIIFMGTATPATICFLYDLIQEKTNWPITKIRRTSTRP